jgi:hypothetical protein
MFKQNVILTMLDIGQAGRLGNQMFQWAVLRGLSHHLSEQIKDIQTSICLPWNQGDDFHTVRLPSIFAATGFAFTNQQAHIRTLAAVRSRTIIHYREPAFRFSPLIDNVKDILAERRDQPCVVINFHGYFQSYKYFIDCENTIKADFVFSDVTRSTALQYLDSIRPAIVIACHIRRGDYTTSPVRSFWHSSKTVENYVHRGIELIKKRAQLSDFVSTCVLFFSDDIEWCRENIKSKSIDGEKFLYCTLLPRDDVTELCAMSYCDHLILSNSTYSWWAAWLCTKGSKIVVAPNQWFDPNYAAEIQYVQQDLLPPQWLTAEVAELEQ